MHGEVVIITNNNKREWGKLLHVKFTYRVGLIILKNNKWDRGETTHNIYESRKRCLGWRMYNIEQQLESRWGRVIHTDETKHTVEMPNMSYPQFRTCNNQRCGGHVEMLMQMKQSQRNYLQTKRRTNRLVGTRNHQSKRVIAQFTIYSIIYPVGFYKYNNLPGGIYDIYQSIRMKQSRRARARRNYIKHQSREIEETNHSRVDRWTTGYDWRARVNNIISKGIHYCWTFDRRCVYVEVGTNE